MANTVRIQVGVSDNASGPLDKLKSKFEQLKTTAGAKSILTGAGLGLGVAAFNAIGAAASSAVGAVVDFAKDSVAAAIEEEASIARLDASLDQNVKGWRAHTDAIEDAIKANINLGFSDDQTRDSLAALVPVTHDVAKALDVQKVAMDLARFKNISLTDATTALIRVEAGSYRILKQLGIQLKDGATQTEALAAVEKVAAGQAAAFGDTTAGKMAKAEASIHDLQEEIGTGLLPIVGDLADAATDLVHDAEKTSDAIHGIAKSADDALRPLGGLNAFFGALKQQITPLLSVLDLLQGGEKRTADQTDELKRAQQLLARSTTDTTGATRNFTDSQKDAADQAGKTTTLRSLADRLNDIRKAAQDARDALYELAHNVLDRLYGPAITAGRLAELKKQLRDAVKEQDNYKRGTEAWVIAHGRVADLQEQIAELTGQQAKAAGDKAYAKWLQDQIKKLGASSAAAQEYVRQLNEIEAKLKSSAKWAAHVEFVATWTGAKPRQHGGPVWPGNPFLVGEHGPEVFVPDKPGRIIPNGKAGNTYNLTISGATAVSSPLDIARMLRRLEALGPAR